MSVEFRGAGPAGLFVIAEGAIGGVAALLFGGLAVERAVTYDGLGDQSGVAALAIVVGFAITVLLAVFSPVAILTGRAVRRGSHPAWVAAIIVSLAQLLSAALLWPLAAPLGLLGAVALVLLLLPETRAECAPPPVLEEADPGEPGP